jgi:glycosyltransferase involved in cell wall biosynthesis
MVRSTVYNQVLVSRELGRGAFQLAFHVARHLRECGHSSHLWVPGPGTAQDEAVRLGLPCSIYDAESAASCSVVRAGLANWRLGRALKRSGAGLVHVHSPAYYGALRWGLKRSGLTRVVHVQLDESEELLRWAFRHPPELIITCSRFLVSQVRRALPEGCQERQRIEAVPNTVDTKRFYPLEKQAAKARVGAPGQVPLLLSLANLSNHKGQDTAIRVTALLKQRGVDVICWLAVFERKGAATQTSRLEELVRELGVGDRVRLLGFQNDVSDLLRAADLFLLPFGGENLSILEAQATKVPVLAAPTAGVPEVVHDGETGFLVAAGDAPGYARCLENLLHYPELGRKVAEAAYERIRKENDWQTFCRRVSELYQSLVRSDLPTCRWDFFRAGKARVK